MHNLPFKNGEVNMVLMKRALITGITGQDGSYLAEFLIKKGYEVYGLVRRTSNDPLMRIDDLSIHGKIKLVSGSLRDLNAVSRVMDQVVPDEVYNLAAQSHVGVSFDCPEETLDINYYGVGRVVNEAIRVNPKVRIYQASTSEMFGKSKPPQNEETPFQPVSPYAEAKLKAHEDFVVHYREKGYYICSGILFNHESPRRGSHFVTRKITISLAKIKLGLQDNMELGNLDAKRDWGYALDYVEAMWLMLQQDKPNDFVIATGKSHSVREFVELAAAELGIGISWSGSGLEEKGMDKLTGKVIVKINPKFYRPAEVDFLLGDATKAKEMLGWEPKTDLRALVSMMVKADEAALKSQYLK
jgi:GDPmannose 4,6-dehydratase